ncbi:hypothetical protein HanIR_Chr14g0696921 [Helianthus annuus]|nr:hypothetical protein HanIR_Chr14g0696921 [Helianthus annuus]
MLFKVQESTSATCTNGKAVFWQPREPQAAAVGDARRPETPKRRPPKSDARRQGKTEVKVSQHGSTKRHEDSVKIVEFYLVNVHRARTDTLVTCYVWHFDRNFIYCVCIVENC